MGTMHAGPFGTATELDIPDDLPGSTTTVCWWLLTGPWHPLWSQFILGVVHLRPEPGAPEPKLQFPGATHELFVAALNPEGGARSAESMLEDLAKSASLRWLEPLDVVHQFTATDDEMRQVANLAAWACVNGTLTPSTDDARAYFRECWLTAIVKTLAHIRGEEHAS